jgi:hypothetical protein
VRERNRNVRAGLGAGVHDLLPRKQLVGGERLIARHAVAKLRK